MSPSLLHCNSVECILLTFLLGASQSPHQAEPYGDRGHVSLQGRSCSRSRSPSPMHRTHSGHKSRWTGICQPPRQTGGAGPLASGQGRLRSRTNNNRVSRRRHLQGLCSGVPALSSSATHSWRYEVTLRIKLSLQATLCPGQEPGPA